MTFRNQGNTRINILTMHELLTYTPSDFTDLSDLMQELSNNIVFTRESLERMLADNNSRLYVAREEG